MKIAFLVNFLSKDKHFGPITIDQIEWIFVNLFTAENSNLTLKSKYFSKDKNFCPITIDTQNIKLLVCTEFSNYFIKHRSFFMGHTVFSSSNQVGRLLFGTNEKLISC